MTYRRRYLSMLQADPVLDLLLADETNPRSLAYQLVALAESIDRLPRDPALPGRSAEQRLVLANLTEVRLADLDALARAEESGRRTRLTSLLCRPRGRLAGPLRGHRRQLLQPPANLAAPGQPGPHVTTGRQCSTSRSIQQSMTMSNPSRSATMSFT